MYHDNRHFRGGYIQENREEVVVEKGRGIALGAKMKGSALFQYEPDGRPVLLIMGYKYPVQRRAEWIKCSLDYVQHGRLEEDEEEGRSSCDCPLINLPSSVDAWFSVNAWWKKVNANLRRFKWIKEEPVGHYIDDDRD